jgi:hypothetical protein
MIDWVQAYSLLNIKIPSWIPEPNMLDRVLVRLTDLANEELESRIGRSERCYEIQLLSDADRWELVLIQARNQLAKSGIEPATFDYDLTAHPAIVCLVELVKLFDAAEPFIQESKGKFLYFIEQEYPQLDRTVARWLERRAESRKRSARASMGANTKAANKREFNASVTRRFDPGESSGKSKSNRERIIHTRFQAAKARGEYPEDARLPRRLRTYF